MLSVLRLSAASTLVFAALVLAGLEPALAAFLTAVAMVGAAWFRGAPAVIAGEVRAVRLDPDFGRLGLFGDRVWRGSVDLPGLPRALDLEIETEGVGPTLAHRLALRDARLRWQGLRDEIGGRLRDACGECEPRYLTLRLPLEADFADQDWSVEGLVSDAEDGRGFQVRVRDGGVVGVEV